MSGESRRGEVDGSCDDDDDDDDKKSREIERGEAERGRGNKVRMEERRSM